MRGDGSHVWAQVPRDTAERMELDRGQIVYIRPIAKGMVSVPVEAPEEAVPAAV